MRPSGARPGEGRSRRRSWKRLLWAGGLLLFIVVVGLVVYYDVQFSALIDARLSGQVFNNPSLVFGAPTPIQVGETVTPEAVTTRLRKAQYAEESTSSKYGSYRLKGQRLEITPGPQSYFSEGPDREGPATIEFSGGRITSISSTFAGSSTASGSPANYWLEPELVTTLFDENRAKRRVVRYQDLSPVLVNATLAAEDRRFFSHHGVNVYRILAAAFKDLRADERLQGGSTLTMQLARNFFLSPRRTFSRKVKEIFLALLMEQRLTKEQILALYANEVYLGQRGSFSVEGFGEAADAYFNKDVKALTLPEAALLAGLIRGPNLYNPYRHKALATKRRNYVLREMAADGFISAAEAEQASQAPLGVSSTAVEGSEAPYFVDIVKDQLLAQFSEQDLISQSFRIYTTLDLDLQRAAAQSVASGMTEVDARLAKRKPRPGLTPLGPNQPQVALAALDPHTGEVRALVGGRDYGSSQLDHALARRQPGSSFKPFVYAAALNTALDGSEAAITTATVLQDQPTTFEYEGKTYDPRNYKEEYHGAVTLREALKYSLNCATVSLAQMVGYDKVKRLAIEAGINKDLLATPAIALGAYVATPMEITGAYTIFANGGEYLSPRFILAVRDSSGRTLWQSDQTRRQVLDPRVSYLMVNLMQTVIDHGTAEGVRARGFYLPAAGKTGTSHDGWFAGFTSNLLAVVWVGYDDDRELNLSGAASALPVWTDFMKRATALPDYHNAQPFVEPAGIVTEAVKLPPGDVTFSPTSGGGQTVTQAVAQADPLVTQDELFIAGTEPQQGLPVIQATRDMLSRILHLGEPEKPASSPRVSPSAVEAETPAVGQEPDSEASQSSSGVSPAKKKQNVVKKFFSIFKHKKDSESAPSQPPPAQPPPAGDPQNN